MASVDDGNHMKSPQVNGVQFEATIVSGTENIQRIFAIVSFFI